MKNRMTLPCLLAGIFMFSGGAIAQKKKKESKFIDRMRYAYVYSIQKPVFSKDLSYQDSLINVKFEITKAEVTFTIQNQTDNALKIKWEDTALIMLGDSKKVLHKGVKYADRSAPQPSSIIPPKSQINDFVVPTENVSYESGYSISYVSVAGGWKTKELYPTYNLGKTEIDNLIHSFKGTSMTLYLPIVKGERQHDYMFEFKIEDIVEAPRNQDKK